MSVFYIKFSVRKGRSEWRKIQLKKIVFAMFFPIYGVAYTHIYNAICGYIADFIGDSGVPFIFVSEGYVS